MRRLTNTLCSGWLLLALTGQAAERTGREINELVRELNRDLAEAKTKVEQMEQERLARGSEASEEVLPDRAEALGKLEEATSDLDAAEDPEAKKALAAEVESRVLEVAKLSADFLEAEKLDLVSEDEQLAVIEEALANAVAKMGKLHALARAAGGALTREQQLAAQRQSRRDLQKVAKMVELLAPATGDSKRWHSVRQTIALQSALLRRAAVDQTPVHRMLAEQQRVYEQALAQIVLARQGIAKDRSLLAQVALGEVARSLVRRAASLLLGTSGVRNIGAAALAKAERRQQNLLAFLEQDREAEQALSGDGGDYNNLSDEYEAFLDEDLTN